MAVEERILRQAPAVLARGGKTTVAEFAAAAGISRASFYRHFKSREALLEALEVAPEPGARERILDAAADEVGCRTRRLQE
jgi:predicted DNA-binding transcriptional regulator YafY